MIFLELEEFKKELKSLLKKYRSLTEDLEIVKQILLIFPNERPPFSFEINDLKLNTCIIKVKKLACKSLKGRGVNSGLRLVYAYFPKELKIVFVELYHKNTQENEDRERIMANFFSF
jgi:mRNA-degrading endonuclease RelE of RelBE toxin-antitoxin system